MVQYILMAYGCCLWVVVNRCAMYNMVVPRFGEGYPRSPCAWNLFLAVSVNVVTFCVKIMCVMGSCTMVKSLWSTYVYVESGYNVGWMSMCTVLCGGPPSFHHISLVLRITMLLCVVSCVVCVVLILKAVRFSLWGVGVCGSLSE